MRCALDEKSLDSRQSISDERFHMMFLELCNDESGVIISRGTRSRPHNGWCSRDGCGHQRSGRSRLSRNWNDVSNAIGALNQTYFITGFTAVGSKAKSGISRAPNLLMPLMTGDFEHDL